MFIKTPASHANDPLSSFEAEERINKSGKRKRNQDIVFHYVKVYPESTAAELYDNYMMGCLACGDSLELDLVEFRRRLSDMKDIRVERRKELRKCRIAKKRACVWYSK